MEHTFDSKGKNKYELVWRQEFAMKNSNTSISSLTGWFRCTVRADSLEEAKQKLTDYAKSKTTLTVFTQEEWEKKKGKKSGDFDEKMKEVRKTMDKVFSEVKTLFDDIF